jgi:hypothetical protein
MWFNAKDVKLTHPIIKVADLQGYVLPHAGTEFTGVILAHTLRFRPTKVFTQIVILYSPAGEDPDVDDMYYHEYYVPWKALELAFGTQLQYTGYNVRKSERPTHLFNNNNTLIVVSADYSHFLPTQEALALENKAVHALMFRQVQEDLNAVDTMETFRVLYELIPPDWMLQWVGRTRSPGKKGVGYHSFLLQGAGALPLQPQGALPLQPRSAASHAHSAASHARSAVTRGNVMPDGIFVTAFSAAMTAHECLGDWFTKQQKWSIAQEQELIAKVLRLGKTESRLTGGTELNVPLPHYTVTYLYKTNETQFIRGWHGILHNAFYLPEVFLENTYENGTWIKPTDLEWPAAAAASANNFDLTETLTALNRKAGLVGGRKKRRCLITYKYKKKCRWLRRTRKIKGGFIKNYTLYTSRVMHYSFR